MKFKSILASAAIALSATAAHAATYSGMEAITGPNQVISFSETVVAPMGAGSLTVVLNGDFSDGPPPVFDIETAVMTLDTAGSVRLRNNGGAVIDNNTVAGLSLASGVATNFSFDNVELTFNLDLTAGLMSSILGDNNFSLSFTTGSGVDISSRPDFISYSLDYAEVAPIPLPAAGFLLLGGLGAFGAMRRRKKNAA